MDDGLGVERLWQLTAEHSPVGMTLVRPDGVVLTANRALCAMLRCEESDLQGQRYELLTHLDERGAHTALFDEMVSGARDSYRLTKRCLRLDGSVVWGDLSAAVLRSDAGEPLYVIGQISDVTQQRIHEQQLSDALDVITRQRQMSQAILDSVDVGLLLIDREGSYEDYNRRHADLLDLAYPDGHRGQSGQVGEVYAADGVTLLASEDIATARAANGEEFDDYRIWVGSDPLRRRALAVSARSVIDASGRFAGAALAYNDVTDLMRAIQARDDFLAAVSHELRTPLTSVIGHLELLHDHVTTDEALTTRVEVAQRNADRLSHLVADLLESAQHRAGPVALERGFIDVGALVAESVESAGPSAQAAGIELRGCGAVGPVAEVDHQKLRQVVDNLVSNALKYTDRGGSVDVWVDAQGGGIRIGVRDDGIGIDPTDQARLFTPFFRSDRARERQVAGVGLGLGICEAIVVAHGGRIAVKSAVGEGTTFTVSLPLMADSD